MADVEREHVQRERPEPVISSSPAEKWRGRPWAQVAAPTRSLGSVTAGATVVATLDGQPSLFVYRAGAAMSGLTAPA